jgi:hypothetical protein
MSRLTQAIAYINLPPQELTGDWIKVNLTDIEISDELKRLRKEKIKHKKHNKSFNI